MPYAPGVQDISGQLRAQGIAQAGQAWSQAIGNIGKDVADAYQTFKQNQYITNQAMGQIAGYTKANQEVLKYLEGASSDDPNGPTLSPEIIKSWANVKSGKPSIQDAATVKAFLESYDKRKNEQMQQELMGYKVAEAKRAAEFWKNIGANQLTETPDGARIAPAIAAPAPLVGQGAAGIPAVQMGRYGAPATEPIAAAPATVAAPAAAATNAARFATRPTGSPTWADVRAVAVPGMSQAQMMISARQRALQNVKEYEASSVFQGPNAQQEAEAFARKRDLEDPLPNRMIRVPKYSDTARGVVIEQIQRPQTSKEKAEEAAATEQAIGSVKEANTFLSNLQSRGAEAANTIDRNLEIKRFLQSGVETGPLESAKAQAIALASKFGLASKDQIQKANDFDKIRSLMMEDQIKFAQESTRGNLNTYEQKMMASAKTNAENKLSGANEYLNDLVLAAKMKEMDAIAEERRVRANFPNRPDLHQYMQDWINDPKNSINKYLNKINPAQATQAAPAASSASGYKLPSGWSVSP